MVIAIIAVLAGMPLPALAKAKTKDQGIACVKNLKRLQLPWTMYADDHNDMIPPNIPGEPRCTGSCIGSSAGVLRSSMYGFDTKVLSSPANGKVTDY